MAIRLRAAVAACAGTLALSLGVLGALGPAEAVTSNLTSKIEKRRVDSVPTPKLDWYSCYGGLDCTTVKLPLDYDEPKGAQVELAVIKSKARKPGRKIGSLFLNPGGPGGSGAIIAAQAQYFLGDEVLDRFDIVGFDPRGIVFSDNVNCFPSTRAQTPALGALGAVSFPVTAKEQKTYIRASKAYGQACSTTGKPLSVSMSTAEAARDMDVLRRAVGDKKLSYLGFSYGTYLGQVYANLFPDRVRALALDGVLDPIAWAGTAGTRETPMGDRLKSADGSLKALREILTRCDKAGGQRCTFAPGDPNKNFDLIASRLKAKPLVISDPDFGDFTFTYADLISDMAFYLYLSFGPEIVVQELTELIILTEPPAGDSSARKSVHAAAVRRLMTTRKEAEKRGKDTVSPYGFPYDNGFDAFASVACTDSVNPADIARYPGYAAAADQRAPYFGAFWLWNLAICARNSFSATDEDAYRGTFTHTTANPILFVGNYWDPATNYQGAVAAAKLAPNSRLLSSDSWGHTAYGTSTCVTDAVERYLLKVKLPAAGKVCVGDDQPFVGGGFDEESQPSNVLMRPELHRLPS